MTDVKQQVKSLKTVVVPYKKKTIKEVASNKKVATKKIIFLFLL